LNARVEWSTRPLEWLQPGAACGGDWQSSGCMTDHTDHALVVCFWQPAGPAGLRTFW
jgi:hypothetical protein